MATNISRSTTNSGKTVTFIANSAIDTALEQGENAVGRKLANLDGFGIPGSAGFYLSQSFGPALSISRNFSSEYTDGLAHPERSLLNVGGRMAVDTAEVGVSGLIAVGVGVAAVALAPEAAVVAVGIGVPILVGLGLDYLYDNCREALGNELFGDQ
jgi:hypothetical protein